MKSDRETVQKERLMWGGWKGVKGEGLAKGGGVQNCDAYS